MKDVRKEDITILIPTLHPDTHVLSSRALSYCLPTLEDFVVILAENGEGTNYPQGQCKATNRVAKYAKTKWIMVSNNDMVFSKNWFENISYWMNNMGLLVASPNLVEPQNGAPPFLKQFCGGLGNEDGKPDFVQRCFHDFVDNCEFDENHPENIVEDGFNLPFIIRKDVWDTIGGYDEEYDPWGSNSDSDLQYKIMLAGITPKRVRSSLVYHFSNASGTFRSENNAYWQKNFRYFTEKWGFERAPSPEIWYKPDMPMDKLKYHPSWEGKYAKL